MNSEPDEQISDDELRRNYRSVVSGLTTRIRKLYDAIHDHFGTEGLHLIERVSAEYGREIAAKAQRRVKSNDVRSTADYLLYIFNAVSFLAKPIVTEYSDERVAIRVDRCPYPLETPEICRAHTSMEVALVRSLSPDLDYRIAKCIPCGDDYCEHVICKQSDPLKSRV